MLSVKKRQTYLKILGFYKGEVDGKVGKKTKAAYKALQEKYFTRKKDIDGLYGKNTDILLQNAYNVKLHCPSFKLEDFKCHCEGRYCTGYPKVINIQLLKNLQKVDNKFGETTIPSGLRCVTHNKNVGGASGSRHTTGKAVDIKNAISKTESGRKTIMKYWKTLPKWRYTYCNIGGNYPNMATSVHIDVK